jgi:hypothetical protein
VFAEGDERGEEEENRPSPGGSENGATGLDPAFPDHLDEDADAVREPVEHVRARRPAQQTS